jgi:hypothetical protein
MAHQRQIGSRGLAFRRSVVAVAIVVLPLVAGCSSSSSVEYAIDAFPSQSLVDLMKDSAASPTPAPQPASAPAPAVAQPAPAAVPAPAPPPAASAPPTTATASSAPPPAASDPRADADPVAAAFPSVSLIDLLSDGKKPAQQ